MLRALLAKEGPPTLALVLVIWAAWAAFRLALLPLAPVGVWIGVRVAHRIQPELFYRLIYVGMFLTGLKLVWDGFLAGH